MILYRIRHLISKGVWKRSAKIMGRVAQYNPGDFRLSGLVLSSDRDYFYNPWIAVDGTFYCDCQGFEGAETICSHILALLKKADFDGVDVEDYVKGLLGEYQEENDMIYETSLEGYNRLFGGLRGGRHISCLFSEPEIGKSYLSATFAADMVCKHNKSALIIDTEGGFTPDWLELIGKHRGVDIPVQFIDWRVKVDVTQGKNQEMHTPDYKYGDFKFTPNEKPAVYIYDARHLIQIMPFFGRPMTYKIKSGVIEPIEGGHTLAISESPIGIVCDKADVAYVTNDSLSSPIESFFTGGQINYRTRAKATQVWLGRAQELIDEYKVIFMNTVHASIDHTNPYGDPSPVGGKAIMHNNKYIAFLARYQGKKAAKEQSVDWRNLRKLSIFRHMTKGAWSEHGYLITTDHGLEDFYPKGQEED